MFNHSDCYLKKLLFMLTALSLLFGVIDTRRTDHHTIGMVIAAEIDALYQRKKDIRREIEKGRQDVAAITRRESDTIQQLNQVELALNTSKKRAADLKKEIEKLIKRSWSGTCSRRIMWHLRLFITIKMLSTSLKMRSSGPSEK